MSKYMLIFFFIYSIHRCILLTFSFNINFFFSENPNLSTPQDGSVLSPGSQIISNVPQNFGHGQLSNPNYCQETSQNFGQTQTQP